MQADVAANLPEAAIVEPILADEDGLYRSLCSHYLVDPVACTPASGKGQIENQVGLVRLAS